jgi:hypothetical protein
LILLYWDIGHGIVEKQQVLGWGDAVVEMVAADLRRTFPQITGFSSRNVWDMRRLYATYTAPEFVAQAARETDHGEGGHFLRLPVAEFGGDKKGLQAAAKMTESKVMELLRQFVAEVPWGQNLLILNKLSDPAARLYYLRATASVETARRAEGKTAHGKTACRDRSCGAGGRGMMLEHFEPAKPRVIAAIPAFSGQGPTRKSWSERILKREINKPIIRWADSPQLGYEILPNKYFYRYHPPTPAMELLQEFWRLEKEAEKLLEGLPLTLGTRFDKLIGIKSSTDRSPK